MARVDSGSPDRFCWGQGLAECGPTVVDRGGPGNTMRPLYANSLHNYLLTTC
jgi:hypothetical protein